MPMTEMKIPNNILGRLEQLSLIIRLMVSWLGRTHAIFHHFLHLFLLELASTFWTERFFYILNKVKMYAL